MIRCDELAKQIPLDTQNKVCLMGQGTKCCMFLGLKPGFGIICIKGTESGDEVKRRSNYGLIWGDNCGGLNSEKVN